MRSSPTFCRRSFTGASRAGCGAEHTAASGAQSIGEVSQPATTRGYCPNWCLKLKSPSCRRRTNGSGYFRVSSMTPRGCPMPKRADAEPASQYFTSVTSSIRT